MNRNGPGLLVAIGVAAIVIAFVLKKVAASIYQKTGVNTIKGVHKLLWYVQGIAILMGIGLIAESPMGLVAIVGAVVGGFILHTLFSLNAGIGNAIIMGILQGIGGGVIGLLSVIFFLLSLFTGGKSSPLGGMFSIDESLAPIKTADLEKADYAARKNGFADANAWAKNSGYSDASSAYDSGFFKDKI